MATEDSTHAVRLRAEQWWLIDGSLDNENQSLNEEFWESGEWDPDDENSVDPVARECERIREAGWEQIPHYDEQPPQAEVTVALTRAQWELALRALRSWTDPEDNGDMESAAAIEATVQRQIST